MIRGEGVGEIVAVSFLKCPRTSRIFSPSHSWRLGHIAWSLGGCVSLLRAETLWRCMQAQPLREIDGDQIYMMRSATRISLILPAPLVIC